MGESQKQDADVAAPLRRFASIHGRKGRTSIRRAARIDVADGGVRLYARVCQQMVLTGEESMKFRIEYCGA